VNFSKMFRASSQLAICLLLCTVYSTEDDSDKSINEALVAEVNSKATTWRASLKSSLLLQTREDFEARLGAIPREEVAVGGDFGGYRPKDLDEDINLPQDFDARKRWPECPSIGKVVDQGPCGGCWATAATSVAADRYCIQNVGQENPYLSYNDLLTCSDAGSCKGGSTYSAMVSIKEKGLPTGAMRDDDNWQETCSPSPFELCNHHQEGTHNICPDSKTLTPPSCHKECRAESGQDYEKDRYYADHVWFLDNQEEMMKEIYLRGPISVAFRVYKDFYFYLDGVYQSVAGEDIGLHAVKVIGWGHDPEYNLDYWTISNSWDPDWGEDGYMRMKKTDDGYLGMGSLGAEACSMKIPEELQRNVKSLLAAKARREQAAKLAEKEEKSEDLEKDQEEEIGFLVWSSVAPRNIMFALSTLGIIVTGLFIAKVYYELKNCFTKKQTEVRTTYESVPINI